MKRKIFSKLLMVALVIAAVSSFVSCKDYDDDINNLQNQINKAALQSELAALQQTVANNATAAKAAADAAEAAAKKYADELAAKSTAKASDLEKLIAQVKAVADAAATKEQLGEVEQIAKAAATQAALTEAIAELNGAIEKVKAVADAAATKEELAEAQKELTAAIKKVEDAAAAAKTLAQKAQATADKANTDLAAEVKRAMKAEENLDAAIKKALADAKKYTDDALTASKAYTDDEVEKAAAQAAADLTNAIAKVYTKTAVDEKIADAKTEAAADAATKLANALGDLGTATVKDYVNTQIGSEVADLKEELADTYLTKADFEKITGVSGSLTASVNALYKAVTGIELFGSYTATAGEAAYDVVFANINNGLQLNLTMLHGFVADDSEFGDESGCDEVAEKLTFVKDANIPFEEGLVVRVNPVSADLADSKIILVNSKGEGLDDYVVAGTPVRYNKLITRGTNIETGLWVIPFTVKDDVDADALKTKTQTKVNNVTKNVLFAVAVNNTDDSEDRFIASTYDVYPEYEKYLPATDFTFNVTGLDETKTALNNIRNRWNNDDKKIVAEQKTVDVNVEKSIFPELRWAAAVNPAAQKPVYPVANVDVDYSKVGENGVLYAYANNDVRNKNVNKALLPVSKGQPFVISDLIQTDEEYNYNQIAYYYVTLDCHNAIESSPSEINAWNNYDYEGLYEITPAGESKSITINETAKADPKGDVIGFRVFAVNYDGTLADPDGKAFYVYVGEAAAESDLTAKIVATNAKTIATDNMTKDYGKPTSVLQSEEMDITGLFVADRTYKLTAVTDGSSKIVAGTPDATTHNIIDNNIGYFNFIAYKANGDAIVINQPTAISGTSLKDAVKLRATVNLDASHNIYNLVDNGIYNFKIEGSDNEDAGSILKQVITLAIQKVVPTTCNLPVFRPKQETTEGSKKFIAYMVPDSIDKGITALGTQPAAGNYPFAMSKDNNNKPAFGYTLALNSYLGTYTAKGINEDGEHAAKNPAGRFIGFKDLNNVFYNLNADEDYKFTFHESFTDSLSSNEKATANLPLIAKYNQLKNNDYITAPTPNSATSYRVNWLNPYIAPSATATDDDTHYMLAVQKPYIDGTTEHAIDVAQIYYKVSTTLKNENTTVDHFADNTEVTEESAFTVIYSTWIKASNFKSNGIGDLQWTAAATKVDTLDLSKISATNKYNADLFGNSVADLIGKKFLYPSGGVSFSTDSVIVSTSQIDPYFKAFNPAANVTTATATSAAFNIIGQVGQSPIIKIGDSKGSKFKNKTCILVTQSTVQADAAPVADHFEYLVIKMADAFGFEESVSAKVKIKKPTTTGARNK